MHATALSQELVRITRRVGLCAVCACAAATLCGPVAAAPGVTVKPLQSWAGRIPLGVQPPLQSSIGNREDLARIWTQCHVQGEAPAVAFDRHVVLLAVRRGSKVSFMPGTLADGNLVTNVVVTPDMPNFMTCALASVERKGIVRVNGAPIGQ